MAILVFEAAAAGTGVVSAYLLVHFHGHAGALLAIGGELRRVCVAKLLQVAVGLLGRTGLTGVGGVPERDKCAEQEAEHVLVQVLQHFGEQVVAFQLVHHQRVLLFVSGILHALTEVVHVAQMLLPVIVDNQPAVDINVLQGDCLRMLRIPVTSL